MEEKEWMEKNYIPYLLLVLQKNLNQLLKWSNISIEDFSDKLNINDQTIRNLLSYDTLLTTVQLIAILTMLEQEKINDPENKTLSIFYTTLLDPKNYKEYKDVAPEQTVTKKKNSNNANIIGSIAAASGIATVGGVVGTFISSFLTPGLALGAILGSVAAISRANEQSSLEKHELKDLDWKQYLYNASPVSKNADYTKFKEQFLALNTSKKKTKEEKKTRYLETEKLINDYIDIFLKSY